MTTDPNRRAAIVRTIFLVALLTLGLWVAGPFVPALIWAVIIAVAVDPLVQRAERRFPTHPNLIAGGFTAALALLVLAPIAIGITQAIHESHDVLAFIADARAHGVPPPAWLANLPFGSAELTGWWQANLADPAEAKHVFDQAGSLIFGAQSQLIGASIAHRGVIFGFTLLALFFLIRDRDAIVAQIRTASARLLGPQGERIGLQALASVRGTIDGLVLVGIGVGVIMGIVYFLLGVPHPILLGAFTAIAAMIPFGLVVAFLLAALLLLVQGAMGGAIAVVAIGFGGEFVAGHFVRPALIGGATKLPFLWALIGILGGVETMGLLGLFVGPAAMAVAILLWRELVEGEGAAASG